MSESFGWETINLASIPPLHSGEVHIYATRLAPDPSWQSEAQRLLDSSERERAARFRFDDDRYRFEKTRTALRLLLGGYIGSDPTVIEFAEGAHGKPYLKEAGADVQFNVSHTRGAAVLAFARRVELGIDIEHARRKIDIEGVGRRVFTPAEQASITGLGSASALRQFFRLWTAKEAYLKATGTGLSCDPASIEANFDKRHYTDAENPDDPLPYALREIETANQFQVSLAYQTCQPPELRLREFA